VALDQQPRTTLQVIVLAGAKGEVKADEPRTPSAVTAGAKRPDHLKPPVQKEIDFDQAKGGRGRFKDVEPTYFDGQDLDTPTFIRRGLKLSR